MKIRISLMIACFCLPLSAGTAAALAGAVDVDAAVVSLKTNCGLASPENDNCFESMAALSDLTTGWIWNTRNPSPDPDNPLVVNIGPGEFGEFECDGGGNVTLHGSGRDVSILADPNGATIKDCDDMGFLHLKFQGTVLGVSWTGVGSASWTDVHITSNGSGFGWGDSCNSGQDTRSLHRFFGSRIGVTNGAVAYVSNCAETSFYGGEILLDNDVTTGSGILLLSLADFRAYGSALRVKMKAALVPGAMFGVWVNTTASPSAVARGGFHSHGAILNVSADTGSGANIDVTGIFNFNDTPVDASGTAFVLKAGGSGTTTRLVGTGIASPFLWQASEDPPAAASADGQDLFVETDCDNAGDCAGGGSETHLMAYNEALCGSTNPWFDMVTKECRD